MPGMAGTDVHASIAALPALVNGDASLLRRGRHLSTTFLVEVDETQYLVRVAEGRIAAVERGPFLMRPWSFSVRASAEAWHRFWEPTPAPGYHDLFAMKKAGAARIEGDLVPLMAHLRYVTDVLAAPRRALTAGGVAASGAEGATSPGSGAGGGSARTGQSTSVAPPGPPGAPAPLEPIVGRYLRVTLDGRPHRVYFEEAGQGIPLVCLHTAGADGRQFRHLMNDEAVTGHYRVIAFDMPWHGKSLPPAGWQGEEYRLTTAGYVDVILAFCAALGLESAAYQAPWYDDTGWLHRPDIHGGEVCGALMQGLIAPQSPAETRWDTLWGYMQGGPGVFKGDLHFYRVDGDFRDRVGEIDTSRCPLYLLTGEYDFSCTPADTRWTAERIPGARLTIMREIGHFPMSENPARFRQYILPVLDEIR